MNPVWRRLQESFNCDWHCQEKEVKVKTPGVVPFLATAALASVSPDALGYLMAAV